MIETDMLSNLWPGIIVIISTIAILGIIIWIFDSIPPDYHNDP